MIVGVGYIGCLVLNIQWVGLMPGTPSLPGSRGHYITPWDCLSYRGGHYCSASTTTTSVLTGWTEKSSMIASFEDEPLLSLHFRVVLALKPPFSQSASCKCSISRKATQRIFTTDFENAKSINSVIMTAFVFVQSHICCSYIPGSIWTLTIFLASYSNSKLLP